MSDTIAEFLVSLGYQLNEGQQRKFDAMMVSNTARSKVLDDSLRDIGKTLGVLGEKLVNLADRPHRQFEQAQNRLINRNTQLETSFKRLGWTATATVSTFVAGFGEIAREYDKLFYTQQRTGLSGSSLAALQYGGTQIGAGTEGLVQASEALARSARNPGMNAILRGWGVTNNNGTLKSDALDKFMDHLKNLPPYLQDVYANMFGIPNQLMRDYLNNIDRVRKAQEDWRKLLGESGVDYDKFIKDANTTTIQFEGIWQRVRLIMIQAFEEAFPVADKLQKKLIEFLDWSIKFNSSHPGAALAENFVAASLAATTLLGVLQKFTGIPLLSTVGRGALPALAGAGVTAGVQAYTGHPQSWWNIAMGALGGGPAGILAGVGSAYSRYMGLGLNKPHFAQGGIVDAFVHAGEMVLPENISSGLQSFFSGGGEGFISAFKTWIQGGTGYVPYVKLYGLTPGTPGSFGGGGSRPGGRFGGAAPSPGDGSNYNAPTDLPGGSEKEMLLSAASRYNVNGADLLRLARAEGGVDAGGKYGTWDVNGMSYGPLQMHIGGLADKYRAATGHDPADPKNKAELIDYGVWYGSTHGWGPWTAARSVGSPRSTGPAISTFKGGSATHGPMPSGNGANFKPPAGTPDYFTSGVTGPSDRNQQPILDRTLEGKSSSMTIHNDEGDKNVHVSQVNHFHGSGKADGDAMKALHRYAGLISRNVQVNAA